MSDAYEIRPDPIVSQEPGVLFEHFERLILLSVEERRSVLSQLRATSPHLAAELENLLRADAEVHALDQAADGGGQKLAAALTFRDVTDVGRPEIPGYRVLGVLGEGGMGRVHLAERDVQGYAQRVAIKLVRRDRSTAVVRARFLSEQRHLAVLDHPGICRFIEAGLLADGSPFVVMEAIEGRSLLEHSESESLDLEQRVSLLRRLLDAVAHAHERLLIHRDLKPSNVLVTVDGQPKLLDFGISKSLSSTDVEATATSDRFFSLSATSPEQLLGQPLGVGCDVYALGLLAYRLLSGMPVNDPAGLQFAEVQDLILHRAPPQMSHVAKVPWAARLTGDLDAIISCCLRKSPSERYANVRDFDADLARWQRRLPISVRHSDVAYRARLFLRRNLARVVVGVTITGAVIVGGVGFWLQAQEVAAQRAHALDERDRAVLLSQLLEDAFIQSDPARAGGEGVSVRTILDAAQAQLTTIEERNPPVFASLADSIARVEVGLGADASAAELSLRALQALQDTDSDSELRTSLRMVAVEALSRTGRLAEAEDLLEHARGDGDEPLWAWQYAMARVEMDRGRYADAESRLKRLLADVGAVEARKKLEARRLLVEALTLGGKLADAIREQERLYAEALSSRHADHPSVLLEELELLRLQSHLPDVPQGIAGKFEHVIEGLIEHYGLESVVVAGAHAAAARAYFSEGLVDQAISTMTQAMASFRKVLGEGHIRTLRAQYNLAMALKGSGRLEDAVTMLGELREISGRHFSAASSIAVRAAGQQATMLAELGHPGRGLDLLQELEPHMEQLPATDSRRVFLKHAKAKLAAAACGVPQGEVSDPCDPPLDRANETRP